VGMDGEELGPRLTCTGAAAVGGVEGMTQKKSPHQEADSHLSPCLQVWTSQGKARQVRTDPHHPETTSVTAKNSMDLSTMINYAIALG
jgi:hypothetical protein